MKRTQFVWLAILLIASLGLAACGGGAAQQTQAPAAGGALDRPAAPAPYAGKTNPHDGDAAAASTGKTIYDTNCASCHGATGLGDGVAAAALDPKPRDLADNADGLKDDYFLWRISEGGAFAPFNSAMPAWKSALSEDQIWQVVTYIRSLK